MFRYIRNVLSGRVSHFNRIRPPIVKRLTSRVSELPSHRQIFFDALLMTVDSEIDDLMGFGMAECAKMFRFDVRRYSEDQLKHIYDVLLVYHIYWLGVSTPEMKNSLVSATEQVVDQPELVRRLIDDFEFAVADSGEARAVFFVAWRNLTETLEGKVVKDPFQVHVFSGLMSASHKEFVRLVRERIPSTTLRNL